ncbi:ABC transporter ATP-binding protein [bacterium]|nr:ABC transporter ATP-binding protein [bacterium]
MINLENIKAKRGDFLLSVNKLGLKKGDFTAVLGNNGSGKSTFFSLLSGFLKFEGNYSFLGGNFSSLSLPERNKSIGLLPQKTTLNMPFDVFYVILTGRFPFTNGYTYTRTDYDSTEKTLREFDILHLRDRQFNELSGGEKQRVLLARILNRETPVMLLDEPLNGIDLRHQHETIRLLKTVSSEKSILVVMHDLSMAIKEFNRFLFFVDGSLAYDVRKGEIDENKLSEIFKVKVNFHQQEEKLFVHTELL